MVRFPAGPGPKSFLIQRKFPQLEELGIAVGDDGALMNCARESDVWSPVEKTDGDGSGALEDEMPAIPLALNA